MKTRNLSASLVAVLLSLCASACAASPHDKHRDLTGVWSFAHDNNKLSGTISLKQTGSQLSGTWHTASKKEDDTPIVGNIDGDTVYLTRYNIWGHQNFQQKYTMSLTNHDNQLYGFGEGFFCNHTDLNMGRTANPPEADTTPKVASSEPPKKTDTPSVAPNRTLTTNCQENHFVAPATDSAKPVVNSGSPPPKTADLQPSPPAVPSFNREEIAHTRWQNISKRLEELVKEYYPKAKLTTTNNTLHFEYNVKAEEGYYGDTLVPKADGILGDITLTDGVLPDSLSFAQELKNGIAGNTTFSFGSYSPKCKYYVVSHLVYPKISPELKDKLLSVISSFKD